MNEKQALDEITYIKEIIQDSRQVFVDKGIGYIFWGILIVLGLLSSYIMIVNNIDNKFGLNWIILIALGWIFSFVMAKKKKKESKSSTFAEKILGAVWLSSGVVMTIIGFVGTTSGAITGVFVSPAIALVLGIAFFVSGIVYGNKWISLTSIGWWAGSILMFYWPGMQVFLIMSFMMILFQIVPGIMLYQQAKKELSD